MDRPQQPYEHDLGDGLRVRSLAGDDDVERIARFNLQIHGEGVDAMARGLMVEHPAARPEHWLLVEDTATGEVVSSLALLPWTLRYDGVEIRSAEMGIVGTAEAYRRRGLVRHLNTRFTQLMRDGGFVMSHIQGIGVFYRQFGYDYAIPLEAEWRMEPYLVPEAEEPSIYTFRPATTDDIDDLVRSYDEASTLLDISGVRDAGVWHYLLGPSTKTALAGETWIIQASGTPQGYLRLNQHGFGTGLIVGEVSHLRVEAARATLSWLNAVARERDKPYIRFNLPTQSSLLALARAYGAHEAATYAWQVRVPDVAAFIGATAPALERRVAASPFAGTTRSLRLDLGRESVILEWQDGRLFSITSDRNGDRWDLRVLPQLIGPLMLGYRSLSDLRRTYPDVGGSPEAAMFADVLWPTMSSFLYTHY